MCRQYNFIKLLRVIKILSVVLLIYSLMRNAQADNPHNITKDTDMTACTSCHVDPPSAEIGELLETKNNPVDITTFNDDGVAMCSTCHNPDDGHKVKLKLDFQIPADLPLGKKNKLTCLTCHYTHGSLSSNRPQASFSFMDELVNADRLRKSFLLRRNNNNGELCLICHNSNAGTQ